MAYRRKKSNSAPKNTTFLLNITSMTDMFTIMLVFLLQTYGSSEVAVTPDKDVILPISKVDTNPVLAIQISLSENELKIADRKIASLNKGVFDAASLDPNDPNFIQPLFTELDNLAKNSKKKEDQEGKVFLMADSKLPYDCLRKVMYTASMAGFPKLKLATMMGN